MKRLLVALILTAFHGVAAGSPSTPEVARYDRYLLVNTSPEPSPLQQLTTLFVPPGLHPSVGEALQYLLRDSGWSQCLPDASRAQLYTLPLPLTQYRIGPQRLKTALHLLAGPAWQLTFDETRREVCFVGPPSLPVISHSHLMTHPPLGPAMAPFFLAGMVQRGEIRLAVIVPPDAIYLHQVVWLRPGEQWRGWQLAQLDEQRAVFRHGKRRLTLKMPE